MSDADKVPLNFDHNPVLVHVGLHKCASTWLQRHLFDNPRIGFCAPWGKMASISVSTFVTVDPLAFDVEETRAILQGAAAPLPEGDQVLTLSHEALSSRPHHGQYYAPYVAERLRSTFGNLRLLIIFREQKALIKSLYGEALRNGHRVTLEEFIGTGNEPAGFTGQCALPFFEFDRLIDMYRDVFGVDRVLALPMEMLSHDPAKFVAQICAFSNRTYMDLPTEERVNTAWGPVTYEVLRWSNSVVRGHALRPKTGLAFRTRRKVLNFVDRVIPSGVQARANRHQKDQIAARVAGIFGASNAQLSDMLGLDLEALGYDIGREPDAAVNVL